MFLFGALQAVDLASASGADGACPKPDETVEKLLKR